MGNLSNKPFRPWEINPKPLSRLPRLLLPLTLIIILSFTGCAYASPGAPRDTIYTIDIDFDRLVICVIQIESSGNPNAVSHAGAIGLMQITPQGALAEFNQFVESISNDTFIYWLDTKGVDLLHTNNKAHYGWTPQDKKGWYLRLPKHENSMALDLYPCPITKDYLFNKKVNVFVGTWYLKRLYHYYKCPTVEHILAAYNGGITRLRNNNWDIKKMPRETRDYVKRVLHIYKEGIDIIQ